MAGCGKLQPKMKRPLCRRSALRHSGFFQLTHRFLQLTAPIMEQSAFCANLFGVQHAGWAYLRHIYSGGKRLVASHRLRTELLCGSSVERTDPEAQAGGDPEGEYEQWIKTDWIRCSKCLHIMKASAALLWIFMRSRSADKIDNRSK